MKKVKSNRKSIITIFVKDLDDEKRKLRTKFLKRVKHLRDSKALSEQDIKILIIETQEALK